MPMSRAPVIEVTGLSKRFGNGVLAVDDLSFVVGSGDVCGLLGPNGAGKTTALRMLLGLVRPTAGSARVLGEPIVPGAPVLGRVGAMIEQAAFLPYLTGRRNLRLWWESGDGRWPAPGLERALDIAGLGSAIDRRVKTYSQYLLIDDPVLTQFEPGTNERYGRFQTGLLWGQNAVRCESPGVRFSYATPKQPTFNAFQTPIYVRKLSKNRGVQVFGRARPRRGIAQAIEVLHNNRVVDTVTTTGYFLVSKRGSSSGKWQLRWSADGVTYLSRVATALADPPASAD